MKYIPVSLQLTPFPSQIIKRIPYAWVVLAAAWLGLTFLPSLLYYDNKILASATSAKYYRNLRLTTKLEYNEQDTTYTNSWWGSTVAATLTRSDTIDTLSALMFHCREGSSTEVLLSSTNPLRERMFDQGSSQCVTYRTILPWMAQETQYCSLRYILGTVYSGNTEASEISPGKRRLLAELSCPRNNRRLADIDNPSPQRRLMP